MFCGWFGVVSDAVPLDSGFGIAGFLSPGAKGRRASCVVFGKSSSYLTCFVVSWFVSFDSASVSVSDSGFCSWFGVVSDAVPLD